ncbi:sensor histidine kinase [Stappia indica]|uniref:sensor histidine kinase n=1 Tax=Stappia indica TaxID=538381 RepID=UPI00082A7316|nr:HAMP domain-containing sensor histidine kinase [Stappia indica]
MRPHATPAARRRGSLRLRLILAGAVSVLAALALAAAGLLVLFERHVERRIDQELSVHLDQLVAGLDRTPDGALVLVRPPGDPRFAVPLSGLYWQYEDHGEGPAQDAVEGAVQRSRSLWDFELALPAEGEGDPLPHRHTIAGPGDTQLLLLERVVELRGTPVRVAVAIDRREIDAATRAFGLDLAPYLAVLALFLMAAAVAQVSVGLRPLAAVRDGLAAIRSGRRARLGDDFPDEIRPLAGELDGLLAAREAQVESARARAGDLAHGLRTPLQVLAGDVERLQARGETEIAAEIETVALSMRRHVERELARARLASGRGTATAVPAAVARAVVAVVSRTPAGSRLDWQVEIAEDARLAIDPDDLAEALGNLAENAARHAVAKVRFTLDPVPDDEQTLRETPRLVRLAVRDDGPGIPDDMIGPLTARGGRLDLAGGSGSGAGLGLAIVSEIAEAWGGSLVIGNRDPGLEAALCLRPAPSGE